MIWYLCWWWGWTAHCVCHLSACRCWWCKRCQAEDLKHMDMRRIHLDFIQIFISCIHHWHDMADKKNASCLVKNVQEPFHKRKAWDDKYIYKSGPALIRVLCIWTYGPDLFTSSYLNINNTKLSFTCNNGTAMFSWNLLPDGRKASWGGLGLNEEACYWLDLGAPGERNARVLHFVNARAAWRADVCRANQTQG